MTRSTLRRERYGRARRQWFDVTVPPGDGPFPVVVLLHGGFWKRRYTADLMTPLRYAVAGRQTHATVNVEYRSVGDRGGGWPGTLDDVAAAVDSLASLDLPLDLRRVTALGHSAGGHLAAWLAGRPNLPAGAPGAAPEVVPSRVVSLAGVHDLAAAWRDRLGDGAVDRFLGGGPGDRADRYAKASPAALLPFAAEVVALHGADDDIVPASQSEHFVTTAEAQGVDARMVLIEGADHFSVIDPGHPAGTAAVDAATA